MEIINRDEVIDQLEAVLFNCPQIDCPLVHRFTPGMYIREIFMPAGTMLTSMIHKTEHPYVVSQGKVNNRLQVMLHYTHNNMLQG